MKKNGTGNKNANKFYFILITKVNKEEKHVQIELRIIRERARERKSAREREQ
jgi:hypothetical protein